MRWKSPGRAILLAFLGILLSGARVFAQDGDTAGWSKERAGQYLDERAQAWFDFASADRGSGKDKISCISCHTVVPYALARPALRKLTGVGEPTKLEARLLEQTKRRVEHWNELDSKKYRLFYDFSEQKKKESWGTEAILNALILSFDDCKQGRKETSEPTKRAFSNLWQVQLAEGNHAGSWEWLDFGLEPWESKGARCFGAAIAAIAVGTAPHYYTPGADADLEKKVQLLQGYLRGQLAAQNLHNRIWILWASTKLKGLLSKDDQRKLIEAILEKQQADGGWNLSCLGTLIRNDAAEQGVDSDSYATGLILHVLQTAGLGKNEPKVAKGLTWLKSHQAETGEWRSISMNKKRDPLTHAASFAPTAATAFAVLALSH